MLSRLILIALLACTQGLRGVKRKKGCEKTYHTFSEKLKMCNAETKEMEEEADVDIGKLEAQIEYNDCRIDELEEEWEVVRDEFRTGNPYLEPSFVAQPSNKSDSVVKGDGSSSLIQEPPCRRAGDKDCVRYEDPLDEYYYSDTSPVEDPECVCFLDDQCECVAHCRNLLQSCIARYKSTRLHLYEKWKNAKRRIRYQEGRIYSLEENIRRTRAADPEKDTDGKVEGKYRVSRCGGKPHVVR